MILEPASLRLFTASDISATEFETMAIKIFAPAKKKIRNYTDKRGFYYRFFALAVFKIHHFEIPFHFWRIIPLLDIKAKIL